MPNSLRRGDAAGQPSLSRSGFTHPYGKLNPMPRVFLGDETTDGLRSLANRHGVPLSEYVRTVLEAHVHGPDQVAMVAAARVRAILGTGASMGPSTGAAGGTD